MGLYHFWPSIDTNDTILTSAVLGYHIWFVFFAFLDIIFFLKSNIGVFGEKKQQCNFKNKNNKTFKQNHNIFIIFVIIFSGLITINQQMSR